MNNNQIMQMLGIDEESAEKTRTACGIVGLDAETTVKAIKCGIETHVVSCRMNGDWLITDIRLYDFIKEMER